MADEAIPLPVPGVTRDWGPILNEALIEVLARIQGAEGVTDALMTNVARNIASDFARYLIDIIGQRVPEKVAEVIGDDTTVTNAAASAVTDAIAGRSLLEVTDPRVMQFFDHPKWSWGVVDRQSMRGILMIDRQGRVIIPRPAPIERLALGASAVEVAHRPFSGGILGGLRIGDRWSELRYDRKGKIPADVARAIVERGGGRSRLVGGLLGVGDSLTDQDGLPGWGAQTAAALGTTWKNGGFTGQSAQQIAARQGGVPARLTIPTGLPASGAATVTQFTVNLCASGTTYRAQPGYIIAETGQLVHGILAYDGTTMTFTRDSAGEALGVPAGVRFVPDLGSERRGWLTTFWMGRNGLGAQTPEQYVATLQACVDYAETDHYAVIQVPPVCHPKAGWTWTPTPEPAGSEARAILDARNYAAADRFGNRFIPIADYARTEAAAARVGIVLTDEDRGDIAQRLTPMTYRTDPAHWSQKGKDLIALVVTDHFKKGLTS